MPKISGAYRCGHVAVRKVARRDAWRVEYWAQHASERDCPDCIRAAENAQAKLDAANAGLPPLTGKSERQRAYGETCRAFVLERMIEVLEADGPLADGVAVAMMPLVEAGESAAFRGMLRFMRDQTDAAFWCDCKSSGDQSPLTGQRLAVIDFVMERMGLGKRTATGFRQVDGYMYQAARYGLESVSDGGPQNVRT